MDTRKLARLGIPLPPDSAFKVEMSEHEKEILFLFLLGRVNTARTVKSAATVTKSATTTAAKILESEEEPRMVVIQNNSTSANVWIAIGVNPTAATFGIQIPPSGYWESPWDFKEDVRAVTASGTATLTLFTSVRS